MARVKYTNGRLLNYIAKLLGAADRTADRTAHVAERSATARAAVDTGEMRDKTHAEHTGPGRATLYADADHSGFVEFGTYKMAAQPWFVPGVEDAARELPRIAAEEFRP